MTGTQLSIVLLYKCVCFKVNFNSDNINLYFLSQKSSLIHGKLLGLFTRSDVLLFYSDLENTN
jgi:hypothetical protein